MSDPAVLAGLSDQLLTGTVAAYLLACLLYAAALAYERSALPPARLRLGRLGTAVTLLGWGLQLAHTVTLGLAAGRLPWGTMGEFVAALVLVAVACFVVLVVRYRVERVGVFVLLPAVAGLAAATTVLYRPLPHLAPALHSYWLGIHVTAAIVAAGVNTVATALAVLYLVRDRTDRTDGTEDVSRRTPRWIRSLPDAAALNALAHRTVVFAFPVWTLAIVTGSIWADVAWGRFWGWDPKETWAFVAWVGYAAYLHARSTQGWKARKAAAICCAAYACMLFNLVVVNVWLTGLHSYAGV